jgi:hypothetical protein
MHRHGVMSLAGWRFRRRPRDHWSGPGGIDDLCERHQHLINTIISMSVTVSRMLISRSSGIAISSSISQG